MSGWLRRTRRARQTKYRSCVSTWILRFRSRAPAAAAACVHKEPLARAGDATRVAHASPSRVLGYLRAHAEFSRSATENLATPRAAEWQGGGIL